MDYKVWFANEPKTAHYEWNGGYGPDLISLNTEIMYQAFKARLLEEMKEQK